MHEQSLSQGNEARGIERLRWLALTLQDLPQDPKVCTFICDITLMVALYFGRRRTCPSLKHHGAPHPRPNPNEQLRRRRHLYSQADGHICRALMNMYNGKLYSVYF